MPDDLPRPWDGNERASNLERDRQRLYQRDSRPEDLERYRSQIAERSITVSPPAVVPRRRKRSGYVVIGAIVALIGIALGVAVSARSTQMRAGSDGTGVKIATADTLDLQEPRHIAALLQQLPTSAAPTQREALTAVRTLLESSGSTDAAIVSRVGIGPSTWSLGAIGSAAAGRTLRVVVVTSPNHYEWVLTGKRGRSTARDSELAAGRADSRGTAVASVVDVGVQQGFAGLRLHVAVADGQHYICLLVVTE